MSQGNIDVSKHAEVCPVREIIERVGGKWSMQIILAVSQGPLRFTELERSIEGISRRMLTLTLRNLERDGLVTGPVHPTVRPKGENDRARVAGELHETLQRLTDWAERNRVYIAEARAEYDAEREPEPA